MKKSFKKLKQFIRNNFLSVNKKIELSLRGKRHITFTVKDYFAVQKSYTDMLKKVRKNIEVNKKIKVGFLVNLAASFAARPIYEQMLNDDAFEPVIVVVPFAEEISEEFRIATYNNTLKQLTEQYKNVLPALNPINKNLIDFTDRMDIAFLPTPAQCDIPQPYNLFNLIQKGILTYLCNYSWPVLSACHNKEYGEYWNCGHNFIYKIFTETQFNLDDFKLHQPIKGYNGVVAGYAKMDKLATVKKTIRNRKKIIIAPHHSIHSIGLCSQFLKYADFIQKLPKLYPDIDFVFRPHPNLIGSLSSPMYWGKEKTDRYLQELFANDNLVYDDKAEYFDLFINSDGIIHDCGSFLPEYLMTGNPPCFVLRDEKVKDEYWNTLGKECLEQCYQAFSQDDMINYIEEVVRKENDTMKKKRMDFADKQLKINYPNVASFIINYLKEELL